MQDTAASPAPRTKRSIPRSAVACGSCRDRKSKCDGRPSSPQTRCSLCQRLDLECYFAPYDARKWPSSKYHVQHLRDRIAKLEEALSAKDGPNLTQSGTSQSDNSNTYNPPDPQQTSPATTSGGHNPNQSSLDGSSDNTFRRPSLPPPQQPLPPTPSTSMRQLAVTGEESSDSNTPGYGREDVFRKFSSWNGQFKVDNEGRTRYYGATSDHHTAYESETTPDSIGVDSSASSSGVLSGYSSFQDHLLQLFFDHPHPFLRIPDREAFMAGVRRGRKTQWFSPFLLNCIVLRSLHLTDNPLAKRLEDGLFERVREQLFGELERPDHNTVLGLLFFATYITGQLKHGLGWIYVGIAGRLVVALGLHQDSTPLFESGRITRKELDYRHMIFWAAFVNDSMWSISLGRPNSIRLQDIACPTISPIHSSPEMALLSAWSDLCKIQVEIVELYTSYRSRSTDASNLQHAVAGLDQKLSEWHDTLPDTTKYNHNDSSQPASRYTLHLAYLASCIVLHRPLTAFRDLGRGLSLPQALDNSRRSRYDTSVPTNKCRSAALEIAQVLKEFTTKFRHKQMPTLLTRMSFIASTTLIFGILSADKSQQEQFQQDRVALQTCSETLGLSEQLFPSAKFTRAVLHRILKSNQIVLGENNVPEESPVSMTDFYNENLHTDWAMDSTFGLPTDMNWMQQSMAPMGTGMYNAPFFNIDGQAMLPVGQDTFMQQQQHQQGMDPSAGGGAAFPMQYDMLFDGSGMT